MGVRNLMGSRGDLFCTFLSLLCGLDGLDPQGEIQKMADRTHTTAMQILPMGAFFIQRKPIAMTAVTIAMILHFVPAVMAFF